MIPSKLVLPLALLFNSLDASVKFPRILPYKFYLNSNDCSQIKAAIQIGACTKLVHDLKNYTDEVTNDKHADLAIAENATRMCDEINTCFQSSPCLDVRNAGKIYADKCDKLEAWFFDIRGCLEKVFDEIDVGNTSCTKSFDFLTLDMEVKKKAWADGKSCVISLAEKQCSQKTTGFFKNHYDKLSAWMTMDPDGEFQCGSLHDELIALKCERENTDFYRHYLNGTEELLTKHYETAKNCMKNYCLYASTQLDDLTYLYNYRIQQLKLTSTPKQESQFESCIVEIIQDVNVKKNKCALNVPNSDKTSQGGKIVNPPESMLRKWLTDKKCLKAMVQKKCWWLDEKKFEADWEQLQKKIIADEKELTKP